jgi:NAD(P)-dependent dehydrogenase (short-subunit alcohol dehydrogenase family)
MSTPKVAAITGASRGIGAGLVTAYRKLGYAVVANARSIAPSDDPMVLTVAGDIAAPGVGTQSAGH